MGQDRNLKAEKKNEPCCVASGSYGSVWLFGEARDQYLELRKRNDQTSIREAATLERYFQRFADLGTKGFSEQMFKPQGRQKDGDGNDVLIFEFKAYQFRVYGVISTYKGKKNCFLGTSCDESKKRDKANPQKLKKAAEVWTRVEK